MATPSPLRIERPHASLDAFLEADAWTVDRTDMVLIGVEGVAAGETVKFEIVLVTGEAVVTGEGRAMEQVPSQPGRPGGLRIRFRQLDALSKAVLRRALEAQKRTNSSPTSTETAKAVASAATPAEAPQAVVSTTAATTSATATASSGLEPERSGVRHSAPEAISAPGNREALLERLRARAPHVVKVSAPGPAGRKTAAE